MGWVLRQLVVLSGVRFDVKELLIGEKRIENVLVGTICQGIPVVSLIVTGAMLEVKPFAPLTRLA